MKLHLAAGEGLHLFSGYGAGYVTVNNVRYERCVVVSPQSVMPWVATGFDALAPADFAFIPELQPEIVLLGTGATQRFPHPDLARALAASGAGVEVMDTPAACRTYNILATEGRRVVAALLLSDK